jgi:uncharacterized protein
MVTVRYEAMPFGFMAVLDPGDELMSCLMRLARHEEIEAAWITGIGAVRELELGFYHLAPPGVSGRYQRREFDEPLEACSLSGTISLLDGEPFPHVHGVFSRPDYSTIGGHVFSAVCHVTLELAVQTSPVAVQRGPVDFCELNLLQLEGHS